MGQRTVDSHLRGFSAPQKNGVCLGFGYSGRFLQGGVVKIRNCGIYYGSAGSASMGRAGRRAEASRRPVTRRAGECGGDPFSESHADA